MSVKPNEFYTLYKYYHVQNDGFAVAISAAPLAAVLVAAAAVVDAAFLGRCF